MEPVASGRPPGKIQGNCQVFPVQKLGVSLCQRIMLVTIQAMPGRIMGIVIHKYLAAFMVHGGYEAVAGLVENHRACLGKHEQGKVGRLFNAVFGNNTAASNEMSLSR